MRTLCDMLCDMLPLLLCYKLQDQSEFNATSLHGCATLFCVTRLYQNSIICWVTVICKPQLHQQIRLPLRWHTISSFPSSFQLVLVIVVNFEWKDLEFCDGKKKWLNSERGNTHPSLCCIILITTQPTKTLMSNSPRQVDFAVGLVDFNRHLPDGQVKVLGEFKLPVI